MPPPLNPRLALSTPNPTHIKSLRKPNCCLDYTVAELLSDHQVPHPSTVYKHIIRVQPLKLRSRLLIDLITSWLLTEHKPTLHVSRDSPDRLYVLRLLQKLWLV